MFRFLRELVYFVVALVEIILLFRFVLRLLAANPAAPFVAWVYSTTQPLLEPFARAFPSATPGGGFVLEFTTLFAILAYAFIGYLLEELLTMMAGRSSRG